VVGDPDGTPVLNCHGGLVSGHDVLPADGAARSLGVCVISPDRPGIGRTDPLPGFRILPWVGSDVVRLLDHLGIGRCSVMGWSEGGQYALGCCAGLDGRIDRAAVIAGCLPLDVPSTRKELNGLDRLLASSAARSGAVLRTYFATTRLLARTAPGALVRLATRDLPAPEAAAVRAEGAWLAGSLAEGARSARGGIDEYRAICAPWGFAPEDVTVPVTVFQGGADTLVPPAWARQLASRLADGRLVEYPDEGHFIGLTRRREALAELMGGASGTSVD
jgi:pimeloyl-ACP methyl ester carboxylesterase